MDASNSVPQEANAVDPRAAVLRQDIARVFRHLGVQSLRASLVNTFTNDFRSTWSINDSGALNVSAEDRPLDSAFPGSLETIDQVELAADDDMIVRQLSPRRWTFAWRVGGESAVVGEVHFYSRHDVVSEGDAALIRLACTAGIPAGGPASAESGEARTELSWPNVERRGQRKTPVSARLTLALLLTTALLASWLALVAVPNARELAKASQQEVEQLRAMADSTMAQALSLALASEDYGDVQSSLSSFHSLGYFRRAVVVNAGERAVAMAGAADGVRIGEKLASENSSTMRVLKLGSGSDKGGALLLPSEAADSPGAQTSAWPAALMTLASALAAAALFVWQLLRRNR